MFNIDGLSNIRKARWRDLRPGTIVLSGARINDVPIPELTNFPVLTGDLLGDLLERYQLLGNREVLVADPVYNFSPSAVAQTLRTGNEARARLNALRDEFQEQKRMILVDLGMDPDIEIPIINTQHVDRDLLIRDSYNSFSVMYGLDENLRSIPSFFHRLDLSLSLGELLSGRLNEKFNLPDDKDVLLHLVVDYSKSMDSLGKLEMVLATLKTFHSSITGLLRNTKISLYIFSDDCRPAAFPLSGHEIARGETNYGSFIRKVLHNRDRNVHNKVILFTDGQPTDRTEAMRLAPLLKKNKIDYTQLVFDIRDEQRNEVILPDGKTDAVVDNVVPEAQPGMTEITLTDEELDRKMKRIYTEFTEFAEACSGNQIILRINELMRIVAVECYDRYVGMLTLATREEMEQVTRESSPASEQRVRDWKFPRL